MACFWASVSCVWSENSTRSKAAPRCLPVRGGGAALSSGSSYERAVHMLCVAPLAVFDLRGDPRAIYLFLGIRAAARRGVTLTIRDHGAIQPFNLTTLSPVANTICCRNRLIPSAEPGPSRARS